MASQPTGLGGGVGIAGGSGEGVCGGRGVGSSAIGDCGVDDGPGMGRMGISLTCGNSATGRIVTGLSVVIALHSTCGSPLVP